MAQTIQWFPGHMAKAFRLMRENLKLVDIVFELVDARIPVSSRNPQIDELIGNKPRLLILTKTDLANPEATAQWRRYFQDQGHAVLALNTRDPKTSQTVTRAARQVLKAQTEQQQARGIVDRPIRVLIAGIPNVGKSTLLNHLIQKNVAPTGNRPGVTKKIAWLKTSTQLELLDSPGVLWPKFDDQRMGYRLAATGAIKDTIYAKDDVALFLIAFLKEHAAAATAKRYHLSDTQVAEATPVDLLLAITAKLGFKDDYERASERLFYDLRQGKLGALTLDMIGDCNV